MIPDETKSMIYRCWREYGEEARKRVRDMSFTSLFVKFPLIDEEGVVCSVVYSVKEARFVAIEVPVATKGIVPMGWPGNAVYCDESKIEILPLPQSVKEPK